MADPVKVIVHEVSPRPDLPEVECCNCCTLAPYRWRTEAAPNELSWWCCSKECAEAAAVRELLGEVAPGIGRDGKHQTPR